MSCRVGDVISIHFLGWVDLDSHEAAGGFSPSYPRRVAAWVNPTGEKEDLKSGFCVSLGLVEFLQVIVQVIVDEDRILDETSKKSCRCFFSKRKIIALEQEES